MTQEYKTTEVSIIDFSKIFTGEEHFTGIVQQVGLPMLFSTNKAMYKCVVGKGIICDTGEKYDTYDQITKEFDFSTDHPIWKNTYMIVGSRPEKELQILTYHVASGLSSIMHTNSYLFAQWNSITKYVTENIQSYKTSSVLLPEIPLLKEIIDGFFAESKNLISHILTIFKLYYLKKSITEKNLEEDNCLAEINKVSFISKDKENLIRAFEKLSEIGNIIRAVRNAISHIEDYKQNSFLLYNVHWENHKTLCPPIIEYKNKGNVGQIDALGFINETYVSLLDICGLFFGVLVQDMPNI